MSHSRRESPEDVQKEREASKHRLLDVWASLADRYTRRLDEDDIVDIRTGEIMIDRGFIRKSRKVDFGAIAAPAAEDAVADEYEEEEEEEDEYGLDELDAFADTTDEVDVTEMGLRAKPVPPMTALNFADAEDLRAFLEEEHRRKKLYGSDVEEEEEEDSVQNQESEVVEHEIVNLVSEDELDNWDVDESSVVVLKQDDSDIRSSISNSRTPSTPQAEPETLQMSPRKGNRVSSDRVFVLIPSSTNNSRTPSTPQAEPGTLQKSPRKSNRVSSDHVVVHEQDDSGDMPASTSNSRTPSTPQVEPETLQKSPRKRNRVSSDRVVVLKQDDSDIPSSTSNSRTPSTPQAEPETLQKSPRKGNLVSRTPSTPQAEPETLQKSPRKRNRVSSDRVVVLKQDDSDIFSSTSNSRTLSIPQAEPETLQKSPRKRKRVSSDSDNLSCEDQSPTVFKIPDNKVVKHKSPQRSSSRSQRPRPSPKLSVSGSESESGYSSGSEQEYIHKPSRSHYDNFQFPYHYPYPHHHQSYLPSPHQNQQHHQHHHHHPPPEMYAPPIPDPRAQFIITQAMHQLSALVGTPWIPPHDSSFIPHTPSRRHQSRRANSIFKTPIHPHPYPYSYDANLSLASLPPESSPEPIISSPEKLSSSSLELRKSSMARARSQSRGRQVSFKIDKGSNRVEVYDRVDVYSTPSKPSQPPPSRRKVVSREHKSTITTTWPSKGKGGKGTRAETLDRESSMEESPSDCGREKDDRKSYLRGQTPGPETGLSKGIKKRVQDSKQRLKGALDVAA